MKQDLHSSLSHSARQQYTKSWNAFVQFCETTLSTQYLPASPLTVSLYVTHLHKQLKHSSIRSVLSAIAFHHKLHNLTDPTKSFITQKLLHSYSKTDLPPPIREPITEDILLQLTHALKSSTFQSYDKRLYSSLFSVMYHAALRVSEVCPMPSSKHTLTRQQLTLVNYHNSQCLKISFTSYKHSSTAPQPILLHPTHTSTCPVHTYSKYITRRPQAKSHYPAFCHYDGQPITRTHLLHTLHTLIKSTGLNHRSYNTHSFRIGRATDLALQGHSHSQIALLGRWKSQAFLKYIKPNIVHSNL